MHIFSDTTHFRIEEPTVVSIGKFDGDHIGHQKIMTEMRAVKEKKGYKTAIFTFAAVPADVVSGGRETHPQINTPAERRQKLLCEGIDYLVEYPFNKEIAATGGEEFIRSILIGKLNMKAIVAGTDCAFGHNRSGNAELLRALAPEYGYDVVIIDKIKEASGRDISSTLIKELLSDGRVDEVRRLMGKPYFMEGPVLKGNRIGGRELGFPTVNIYPEPHKYVPRRGVYATLLYTEEDELPHPAMTNVGTNPSITEDTQAHRVRIETHIFDFDRDLYGQRVCIEFCAFVRDEQQFPSKEMLIRQLQQDERKIRGILAELPRES